MENSLHIENVNLIDIIVRSEVVISYLQDQIGCVRKKYNMRRIHELAELSLHTSFYK